MAKRLRIAPVLLLSLAGCEGSQSVFSPDGAGAQSIATLGWIMTAGGGLIFVLVLVLAVYAMTAAPERRSWLADRGFIIAAGIVFPIVTLSALLVYGLVLTGDAPSSDEEPLRIEVVGEQWWWRVRYLDDEGRPDFVTANEIHIPVGRTVEIHLTTADVIHSFWVPNLAGKLDMIPGRVNILRLQADRAGEYRGQCAEYCGGAHAMMAFYVVAQAPRAFSAWREAQRRDGAEPQDPFRREGRRLFIDYGCGACHTVRGTAAAGKIGPDLTHVGGRLTIAAGSFPANVGTFAGWIADSQHLKPDNPMPSFGVFTGPELRAIAAYLESLK